MRQDRLLEIVGRIYQRPETWSQDVWHCGTRHCVAGHAQNDMRGYACTGIAYSDGKEWLQLTEREAQWLFYGDPSLEEIIRAAISGVCA